MVRKPNSEMTQDQAAEVLRAQVQQRVEGCAVAIGAVLEKHKCGLMAVAVIEGERVRTEVRIVPL
jgi:hypothetical protein